MAEIIKGRWDEEDFEKERKQVLATWPTGKQVDFKEACNYLQKLPADKIAFKKLSSALKEGATLVQPRAGIAPLKAFIEMLLTIQNEGGADFQGSLWLHPLAFHIFSHLASQP